MSPLVFLILMRFSSDASRVSETVSVVVDLMKAQESPSKISAYICWSSGEKLELWKTLSKNFISAKIVDPRSSLTYYSSLENQQVFFVDMDCDGSKHLLKQAEISTLFRYPFRWIVKAGKPGLNFSEYFFGVDSKIFVIIQNNHLYHIKLPYKITKQDTQLIENDLATWEHGKWLYYNKFSVARNRSDLMGSNFRVTYVLTDPDSVNHLTDYRDKQVDRLGKASYLVIQSLVYALNVTENATFRNTWGYRRPGSTQYDGMLGDMQRNETDMGGSTIGMTIDRIAVQDIVATGFSSLRGMFVYRAPLLPFVTNIFVLPFHAYVWISCMALGLLILLILYIIVLWEWKDPVAKDSINPNLRPNIFDILIMELGAITQQGAEKEPKSVSGRMATLFTFIALMFIYNAFCANIVALLQSPRDSINSVDDLYTTDIGIGSDDVAWAKYYLKTDPRPVMQAIVKEKLKFMSAAEGVERMRTEYFAYQGDKSLIYYVVLEKFSESEKCALREVNWMLVEFPPSFPAPKYSAYKELIRFIFKRIVEVGIVRREELRLFTRKPPCNNQGSFGSVGITECYYSYVYFGIGIGISFAVLLLEKLFKITSKH